MVRNVEHKVRVDRQGRIIIPSVLRRALGVTGDGELLLRLRGEELVLRRLREDLERRVEEWYETMSRRRVHAFLGPVVEEPSRWMSVEYIEKKLGLS
jgi:AbrB family looped-hinge helix DNA binding protein